jgi:hypothetical protein
MLLCYLTVDYVRLPLIVGFFASRDRVTYLFNRQLQDLLRAVLFEAAPWVSHANRGAITEIPVRQTAEQRQAARNERLLDARLPPERRMLGTPEGTYWMRRMCVVAVAVVHTTYARTHTHACTFCPVSSHNI